MRQEHILSLSICQAELEFRTHRIRSRMISVRSEKASARSMRKYLVPAGMGDVAIYTELGRLHDGTLRLPCDKSDPREEDL